MRQCTLLATSDHSEPELEYVLISFAFARGLALTSSLADQSVTVAGRSSEDHRTSNCCWRNCRSWRLGETPGWRAILAQETTIDYRPPLRRWKRR